MKMKVAKQNKGKGYKKCKFGPLLSMSTGLHSGVASTISCSDTSLSNVFRSGSLKIDNCSWFGLSFFNLLVIVGKSLLI